MSDTAMDTCVTLTEAARAQVALLLAAEGQDLALRVAGDPGGCGGPRYELFFDNESFPGDVVATFGEVRVVVDQRSAPYLMGTTIDFVNTVTQQGFTIDNPNAPGSGGCGCGGGGGHGGGHGGQGHGCGGGRGCGDSCC